MIGMFDSGVGGLTVLHALKQELPNESVLYFGDTARVPYGNKSAETIRRYSLEIAEFLLRKEIKLLICACNTASAHALETLQEALPIPVIGVVLPGARAALDVSKTKKIALLATRSTIESKAYPRALLKLCSSAEIFVTPCPLLVPLIEEGYLDHPLTRLALQDYLKPVYEQGADTLLLGCTHYPLLRPLLEKILPPHIAIVDSAKALASEAKSLLEQMGNLAKGARTVEYIVSDDPKRFALLGEAFLGEKVVAESAYDISEQHHI
ncbi:MAG: glutamate racemase [Chlamydiia bacterium]|nr:glutamate racemase [Chlamydiia bacterium]